MEQDLKSKIIQLIMSYRDYYGTYHNHKETMAWSAIGLYLAAVIGMTGFCITHSFEWVVALLVSLLIIFIYALSVIFINEQLGCKSYAADMVDATSSILLKLIRENYNIPLELIEFDQESFTPKFLLEEMKVQRKHRRNGRSMWNSMWLFFIFRIGQLETQEKFECAIFVTTSFATIILLSSIWIQISTVG